MDLSVSSSSAGETVAWEGPSQPSPSEFSAEMSLASGSGLTRSVPFSSGNPRIEETRGIIHLYPEESSPTDLPIGRNPLVYVLDVPNHMTYADFCQFCGSFIQHVLEMRVVRNDGVEDHYGVLMRFDCQISADDFYHHFNQRRFSSLEADVCHILYTVDVQYTGSIEHAQSSSISAEQATCPVCLERLDQDTGGILATICNHSFHCSCISNWTDSSCPVCRYCQQQPEKSTCTVCETTENLWMCITCGSVGCGRYKGGHAIEHWRETQHCYSLELETQRVWDYAGDNYVHRLIQSKTDGKLVEFDGSHEADACELCDSSVSEALFNSKIEAIFEEYNKLLTTQLENQRRVAHPSLFLAHFFLERGESALTFGDSWQHFESMLLEVRQETEREVNKATNKALHQRLQKAQVKLDKCKRERVFFDEINKNLVQNKEMWNTRIMEAEERETTAVRSKDKRIRELEEQLEGLMAQVGGAEEAPSVVNGAEVDLAVVDGGGKRT